MYSKSTCLGLENLKYIQDLATNHSIDVTNKLATEIYKKIKNGDTKKPTEEFWILRWKKSKQEYFAECGLMSSNKDIDDISA